VEQQTCVKTKYYLFECRKSTTDARGGMRWLGRGLNQVFELCAQGLAT